VVDEGEAEPIALALHSGARILIDEKRGRNAAKALGIEIRGTLGLEVLEAGYYLDYELIEEVLRKVDEI
jgi:predicted nucleic acid-binding protein